MADKILRRDSSLIVLDGNLVLDSGACECCQKCDSKYCGTCTFSVSTWVGLCGEGYNHTNLYLASRFIGTTFTDPDRLNCKSCKTPGDECCYVNGIYPWSDYGYFGVNLNGKPPGVKAGRGHQRFDLSTIAGEKRYSGQEEASSAVHITVKQLAEEWCADPAFTARVNNTSVNADTYGKKYKVFPKPYYGYCSLGRYGNDYPISWAQATTRGTTLVTDSTGEGEIDMMMMFSNCNYCRNHGAYGGPYCGMKVTGNAAKNRTITIEFLNNKKVISPGTSGSISSGDCYPAGCSSMNLNFHIKIT